MKLLLKGHGVRIPFPETPGVKLRIVFFDTDEGRKQFRTNIIVLFGYRVDPGAIFVRKILFCFLMVDMILGKSYFNFFLLEFRLLRLPKF